jgi:hypothetical protein
MFLQCVCVLCINPLAFIFNIFLPRNKLIIYVLVVTIIIINTAVNSTCQMLCVFNEHVISHDDIFPFSVLLISLFLLKCSCVISFVLVFSLVFGLVFSPVFSYAYIYSAHLLNATFCWQALK